MPRVLVVTSSLSGGAATGMRELLAQLPLADFEFLTFKTTVFKCLLVPSAYLKFFLILGLWLYSKIVAREKVTLCMKGLDWFVNYDDYDYILLGNIGNGFINLERLLSSKVPILWRHSDMWAILDGPHYPTKFHPLKSLFQSNSDLKLNLIERATNIFPSNWLKNEFTKSLDFHFNSFLVLNSSSSNFSLTDTTSNKNQLTSIGFCSASLIDRRKRFFLFTKLAKAYSKDKNLKFLAIGKAKFNQRLVRLIGCNRNINYVGHLTKHQLNKAYESLDIFCQFAEYDNSPNAAIDALRAGLIIIIIGKGGILDYVAHSIREDVLVLDNYDQDKIDEFLGSCLKNGSTSIENRTRRFEHTNRYLDGRNAAQIEMLKDLWNA